MELIILIRIKVGLGELEMTNWWPRILIVHSFQGDSEFDASSWIVAIETAIQIGLGDTTVRELSLIELLAVNYDLGSTNKPQNSSHVDRMLKRTFHRTELPGRSATPLSRYSENTSSETDEVGGAASHSWRGHSMWAIDEAINGKIFSLYIKVTELRVSFDWGPSSTKKRGKQNNQLQSSACNLLPRMLKKKSSVVWRCQQGFFN